MKATINKRNIFFLMHRIQLCGRGCTQKLGFIRVQDIWYATVSDHVSWGSREGCNLLREIAGSVFTLHAESTTAGPSGSLISCYGGGAGVSANNTKCSFSLKKKKIRDDVTKKAWVALICNYTVDRLAKCY